MPNQPPDSILLSRRDISDLDPIALALAGQQELNTLFSYYRLMEDRINFIQMINDFFRDLPSSSSAATPMSVQLVAREYVRVTKQYVEADWYPTQFFKDLTKILIELQLIRRREQTIELIHQLLAEQ